MLTVHALFERFTERAIKAIVFSQREAKALGSEMVYTQHLLLGLIAEEDRSPPDGGFLASGVTTEKARDAVRNIWHRNQKASSSSVSGSNIPFSIVAKRVFESAVEYSKSLGHKFVAPEHIVVALVKEDDGTANRVLYRYFNLSLYCLLWLIRIKYLSVSSNAFCCIILKYFPKQLFRSQKILAIHVWVQKHSDF